MQEYKKASKQYKSQLRICVTPWVFTSSVKKRKQEPKRLPKINSPTLGTGAWPCCSISFSKSLSRAFSDNFSGLSAWPVPVMATWMGSSVGRSGCCSAAGGLGEIDCGRAGTCGLGAMAGFCKKKVQTKTISPPSHFGHHVFKPCHYNLEQF